jgi:hypothetical protein
MNYYLEDELVNTQQEYIKLRTKAEKTRDPKAVKKIREAEKMLEKAEDEADKTMDPKLKKKSDELLRKYQAISNKLWH